MKLGEALTVLRQISHKLEVYRKTISSCPLPAVSTVLEECNGLLNKQRFLTKKIQETKEVTVLEGSSLADVISAKEMLAKKIGIMENLENRTDLDKSQKASLFEQIKSFRASHEALEVSIERCLWDTELLDE